MEQRPRPLSSPGFSWKYSRWGILAFWLYLFFLVYAYGTSMNPADADLWHRFALLDHLIHTGHFPTGDTFSYDADYQVIPDHEWGSALIFYSTYLWEGPSGLVLLKLIMLGATLFFSVRAGLGERAPTMLETFFYSLVLLALLSSFLSTLRCEVFTHFFFALWIYWFQRERQGASIGFAGYIITMVIWANLHGGFVLGLGWLAIITAWEFFTGRAWEKRALLLGLCLLATLINPFGWELWAGLSRALLISRAAFEEWGPVPWIEPYNTFSGYKLLVLWTLAVLYNHVRLRGWKACDELAVVLLIFFMATSLMEARQTSIFALVVGGLLPSLFPAEKSWHDMTDRKLRWRRLAVRGVLVILPLILAGRLLSSGQGLRLTYDPDNCPVGAVAYLRDHHVTGRLLVGFNAGSYALWELRGSMRVSLDGRYDLVYRPETFRKVQHFFAGTGDWREALRQTVPDAVLVNLPDAVYPKMRTEPGWRQVYCDDAQAVFLPDAAGIH